ncbi:primase-helicase family protein [Brevundimonas sp. TWP2-3-2]|uniref:primase-helicase family protein n=1 Tax=Brevundimonas sp. TWP2-3-2 TaxID=2804648 RepID=UPI003CE8E6AA
MSLTDFLGTLYAGATPDEPWVFGHMAEGGRMGHTSIPAGDFVAAQKLVDGLTIQGQHVWLRSATGRTKASEAVRQYLVSLDVDLAGPGHKSTNNPVDTSCVDDALARLGICRPTFVVSTGGGFQYFWRLTQPQTPDARYCKALQEAVRREIAPFNLDPTSDVVRLIRLPSGRNFKPAYGPDFPLVEITEANPLHAVSIEALLALVPEPVRSRTTVGKRGANEGDGRRPSAASILAGCERLRLAGERPETQTEPQWFFAADLFAACDDLQGFIEWSTGHPEFSETATREKFARAKTAATGVTYARLTEVFGRDPEDAFEACGAHSPLSLGFQTAAFVRVASEWIYCVSTGTYRRRSDGWELEHKLWDAHVRGEPGIGRPLHALMRSWPIAPKVERVDFLPGADRFPDRVTFNTWTKGGLTPVVGEWKGTKAHLWHMFPVPDERELVLDALAYHLQNPSVKIIWALLVRGEEGTGKGFLFDALLPRLIGLRNRARVTGDALSEKFTAPLANSQVLCINELRQPNGYEAANRIKEIISEDKISIRAMRQDRTMATAPRWVIASSNEEVPLPITTKGRRFFVTDYMQPISDEVAAPFYDNPDGEVAAFAFEMLNRDVSHFNPKVRPPVTEAQMAIARQTRPGFEGLISDAMEARDGPFERELVTSRGVRDWLRRIGEPGASDRAVTSALTNLHAKMIGGLQKDDAPHLGRANVWAWINVPAWKAQTSKEWGRHLGAVDVSSTLERLLTGTSRA